MPTTHNQNNKPAIPKSLFRRIVKGEIASNPSQAVTKTMISSNALEMLQGAAEERVRQLFENSALVAQVAGRDTLYAKDMQTVLRIEGTTSAASV